MGWHLDEIPMASAICLISSGGKSVKQVRGIILQSSCWMMVESSHLEGKMAAGAMCLSICFCCKIEKYLLNPHSFNDNIAQREFLTARRLWASLEKEHWIVHLISHGTRCDPYSRASCATFVCIKIR